MVGGQAIALPPAVNARGPALGEEGWALNLLSWLVIAHVLCVVAFAGRGSCCGAYCAPAGVLWAVAHFLAGGGGGAQHVTEPQQM